MSELYRTIQKLLLAVTAQRAELWERLLQVSTMRLLVCVISFLAVCSDHQDISQILKSRLATLKIVRAEWTIEDPKVKYPSLLEQYVCLKVEVAQRLLLIWTQKWCPKFVLTHSILDTLGQTYKCPDWKGRIS